ncbi:ABC transporter substrate-binding protein [Natrinema gelatinilyticum]|uniref:ABC transporter substrate-binding protein n=1 Tax=Natrinema gelatinilyticum TaxID=2961571 RepID=UPI0020C2A566|nr:ABC transporter substrate-binding protein [Natrinema gelatinilyticum]
MTRHESNSGWDRRSYLKITGVVGAGSLAGCIGTSGGGDGAISIGAPAAQTGQYDYLQEGCTRVLELAMEQINEAGGPLGREVELLLRDTAVNPQQARNVTDQLTTVDGCEVICGMFSNEIPPNWDFLQSKEVPIITYWPGSRFLDTRGGDNDTPDDTSDDEWVWRTIISDSVHTAGQALNAQQRGYERVGLLNTATEGERSWMTGFKDAVGAIDGVEVVNEVEVEAGASSYQAGINRLFNEDFDAMVMSFALEDAITAIRDFNQGGYDSAILMSDGLKHNDLVSEVGDQLPSENYSALGGASGPYLDQLTSDFDEMYDTENMGDDNHPWAIAAYDALNVIALAIHSAGEYDAAALEQNVRAVTSPGGTEVTTFADGKDALDNDEDISFSGAMSNVNFTPKGDVTADTAIFSATADGWEQQDPVAAADIKEVLESDDYEVSS